MATQRPFIRMPGGWDSTASRLTSVCLRSATRSRARPYSFQAQPGQLGLWQVRLLASKDVEPLALQVVLKSAALCGEVFRFDEVIDYKALKVAEALPPICPSGIDVFFDNVGGAAR